MSTDPRRGADSGYRTPPGSEPMTARSALGLRAVLAGGTLLIALGVGLWLLASGIDGDGELAGVLACAAIVLIAAVNLLLIARRHRERRGGR